MCVGRVVYQLLHSIQMHDKCIPIFLWSTGHCRREFISRKLENTFVFSKPEIMQVDDNIPPCGRLFLCIQCHGCYTVLHRILLHRHRLNIRQCKANIVIKSDWQIKPCWNTRHTPTSPLLILIHHDYNQKIFYIISDGFLIEFFQQRQCSRFENYSLL